MQSNKFIVFFLQNVFPSGVVPKELRHPKLIKLEELVIEHFKKMDKSI